MPDELFPPVIRIDPAEVAAARPPGPPAPVPRTSQLAIASLVLGILAFGFGLLIGPVAIACGVLALGAVRERVTLKGGKLAVTGIVLGCVSMVAWGIGIAYLLTGRTDIRPPSAPVVESAARAELGIEDAPPLIRRALRANVFLQCNGLTGKGTGSAVIVARAGPDSWCAFTNRHVIDCGAVGSELLAALPGGAPSKAKVCGSAPSGVDLAVVRVDLAPSPGTGPLEPVPVRTADLPRVGDSVFAVGNPLGYEASYTAGVVSAVRTTGAGVGTVRVLQVQASVNPGNSGGGLYDAQGRLIGLNTWTASRSEAEGMGFAISAADAAQILAGAGPGCGCELPGTKGGTP
jgi:S1-C subfamily serine protease